jgi:RHS repeat-associated protein
VTGVLDALNQQYQFAYDALGRQTQITRAGVSMTYVYDEVGNRTQRTDYNGVVTNYGYDNLNRLTTVVYPTRTVTYGYDPLNNLTRATNENGTVYISYDNRYRVSSFSDPFFYGISYNYDTAGNRTKLKLNGATYATYTYDAVNRLTSLKDSSNLNFVSSYDAANRLTSRSAPNGVTSSYGYDDLDRLTSLMHTAGATTLSGNLYTYNNANTISSWTTASDQRSYSYDSVNRLTGTSNSEMPTESYSYDAVGNRTASHLSASYAYQPFNKLASTASATYAYDNNGNLNSKTDVSGTTTFTYDEENHLKQVALPTGLTLNYKYDGLGRRIQRTTSAGSNERYVYDRADVLLDLNADWSVATTYLNDPRIDGHIRQTNSATGASYFLTDHLGSIAGVTDSSGNLLEQITYDSFGNSAGSARTRYGYTGRDRDSDTGMLYYRARFYDPQIGRFIGEDPIGFAAGLNMYEYVGSNPLLKTDPWGFYPEDPPRAKNATPEQQARFDAAYKEMQKRLESCDCANLFGGDKKAKKLLSGTGFEMVPGSEGAETRGGVIRIDNRGPFMAQNGVAPTSRLPNPIPSWLPLRDNTILITFGPTDILRFINLGDVQASAFILLHELGHRAKIYGKYDIDDGDPIAQGMNSEKIRKACFPEIEPQPFNVDKMKPPS